MLYIDPFQGSVSPVSVISHHLGISGGFCIIFSCTNALKIDSRQHACSWLISIVIGSIFRSLMHSCSLMVTPSCAIRYSPARANFASTSPLATSSRRIGTAWESFSLPIQDKGIHQFFLIITHNYSISVVLKIYIFASCSYKHLISHSHPVFSIYWLEFVEVEHSGIFGQRLKR